MKNHENNGFYQNIMILVFYFSLNFKFLLYIICHILNNCVIINRYSKRYSKLYYKIKDKDEQSRFVCKGIIRK